jgi:peroxiredoxin
VILSDLAIGSLALYLYPDSIESGSAPRNATTTAETLHRAFRDQKPSFELYHCCIAGVTARPSAAMLSRPRDDPGHHLLSDPTLQLARELGLPTTTHAGRHAYEPQALVIQRGRIRHLFYPLAPHRCADQILAWLKLH